MKIQRRAIPEFICMAAVKYVPGGQFIAAVGGEFDKPGNLRILHRKDGSAYKIIKTDAPGKALAVSSDGNLIAIGYQGDHVDVVDFRNECKRISHTIIPKPYVRSEYGHITEQTITHSMSFSPNVEFLAVGCWDCSAKLIRLSDGNMTVLQDKDKANVDYVSFSQDSRYLIFASSSLINIYDLRTQKLNTITMGKESCWSHVYISATHAIVSYNLMRDEISHYELTQNRQTIIHAATKKALDLTYSSFLKLVVMGDSKGMLTLFDPISLAVVAVKKAEKYQIFRVECAPDQPCVMIQRSSGLDPFQELTLTNI